MKCDKCGRRVEDRREEIEHLLEQHDDAITSHEKDELKRELNQLGSGGSEGSLPVRKLGIAVAVLAVLAGGGYALSSAGIISFSTSGNTGPTGEAVGPAGSTHDHAQFSVFVNGDEIDFSQSRYQVQQTQNSRVHFEAGDGSTIHKHATGVTVGFALESLGMGLNATCLETVDATYCENGSATLTTTANGNEVQNAASHVIQDGEVIEIRYSS